MSDGKQTNAARKKEKRGSFTFFIIMFSVVCLMLTAICAGTMFFWRYIEAYERSRLEHTIQDFQDNVDHGFWESKVADAMSKRLNEFEREGPVPIGPYLAMIRDVRYTLRQDGEASAPDAPVYIMRAGALDIGIVRFAPSFKIGYGFYLWKVKSIDFLESFIDSFGSDLSITASQNAEVLVNGIPVSGDYLVECQYEYGVSYLIEGMYGDAEVTVHEFDGALSLPYHAEGGHYLYPITVPLARRFNIVAPEGASVLVDDEIVAPDKITESGIIPGVFAGVVDPEEVPETFLRYEFEQGGFYAEPSVEAADASGRELLLVAENDGEMRFIAGFSPEYEELYSGTVESFFRAYITFAMNIGGNFDGNLASLSSHVLGNSDLIRRLRGTKSSMDWVGGSSVSFKSLEIGNFRPYGDSYFSCEVAYGITGYYNYGRREVEGSFEVLFVHSGGTWVAVNMLALS